MVAGETRHAGRSSPSITERVTYDQTQKSRTLASPGEGKVFLRLLVMKDLLLDFRYAPRRLSVVLLGIFATIALLPAAVGTYGVISYLVVQRTQEIGVRMALGAHRDVLRLVVGHALKLIGFGTVIGLVLAFLSTHLVSVLLYNVGPFDVTTFLFVTIALASVALLASYIPASRGTRRSSDRSRP